MHIQPVHYPDGWLRRRVHGVGVVAINSCKYPIGTGLVGYVIGLEPIDGLRFRAWFRDLDLGLVEIVPEDGNLQRLLLQARETKADAHVPLS